MELHFLSTKNQNPYAVRWAKFGSGERMPFFISTATGMPLDAVTFWVVAARRALGKQPNTLSNEIRSLMYLFLWADARGVSVRDRVRDGTFLSLSETLDIANFCSRSMSDALAEIEERSSNLFKLDRRRKLNVPGVGSGEKRNRLSTIRSFLEFTSSDVLSNLAQWPPRWQLYNEARAHFLEILDGQIAGLAKSNRDDLGLPEGLEAAAISRLRAVIEPDHPENPFKPEVRFRNYVMVRLLLDVGIRRGELLGIKVSDCKLGSSGTITVHRRPDDPDDPRRNKPATKTAARVLALGGRMTEIVHEWIVHRAEIPNARRSPFLIVNSRDGQPMSLSNINKMMEALRKRVPDLPTDLSPHLLRHSWNDAFSEVMDEKGVSEDQEIKWRMRLMGWRAESSARHYLRRTIRRRSNEVLMEMQDKMTIAMPDIQE